MRICDIVAPIERFAPLGLQEPYDNSGLVVGRADCEVRGVLLAVDVTEQVIDEAIELGCNMIITHHPIIFHPLKRLNGASVVERCVERAIRHDIALYACHTNLDAAPGGMSWRVGAMLGLESLTLLQPSEHDGAGFGVVGQLPKACSLSEVLALVRSVFGVKAIRHSAPIDRDISRVAVVTGSGGSMMDAVRGAKCDLYLTADLRYNDFFAPMGEFVVADMGHFESEFCAIQILFDILSKNFTNFALHKSARSQNPVHYNM